MRKRRGRGAGLVGSLAVVVALAGCAGDADHADGVDGRSTVPDRPGETWFRVTLCSSLGPASIDMPGPVQVDGPRPLAHLPAPTEGTFSWSYGSSDERRYDSFVIDHAADLGADDAAMVRGTLLPLNGEPEVVDLGEMAAVGEHVELPYVEIFNDRKMFSFAMAARGVVYAFSVGVRQGSGDDVVRLARSDLEHMRASVSFPGLDAPSGEEACQESQEAIPSGAPDGSPAGDGDVVEES